MFLAASLDPAAVARFFVQRGAHERELTPVESLPNAHAARLLALLLRVEPCFALAAKRLLLLLFARLSGPGIATLLQGAEFFALDPFAAKPAPLRLEETVGRFRSGVWETHGAHWGFGEATRRLIALRRRLRWHAATTLTKIEQGAHAEDPAVLVMQAGTRDDPVVFVVNVAARNHTDWP